MENDGWKDICKQFIVPNISFSIALHLDKISGKSYWLGALDDSSTA